MLFTNYSSTCLSTFGSDRVDHTGAFELTRADHMDIWCIAILGKEMEAYLAYWEMAGSPFWTYDNNSWYIYY